MKSRTPGILFLTILLSAGFHIAAFADDVVLHPSQYPAECQPSSKTLPPWLRARVKKGQLAAVDYLNQPWYKAWEMVTLSRCTDLTAVATGTFDADLVARVIWRGDRRPLFRGGAGRPPESIFTEGFYPWKYDGELVMPTGGENKRSALVNTGYLASYDFASAFGVLHGLEAYLIDAPGGINQDTSRKFIAGNDDYLPKQEIATMPETNTLGYMAYNVVVFPGGIRREYIKGVFRQNAAKQVEYLSNPNYLDTQPKDDEFDVVLSSVMDADGRRATISVTPQGIAVGSIAYRYKKGSPVTIALTAPDSSNSDMHCWYVNAARRSEATADALTLTSADEQLPVAVIWRGSCK
ncbi:hypothetical protein PMI16_02158 [Herbaspirillum sp. CF444]|uniref:scabin-related ADP-ribosyltransferase n=1 Tax=Herbaspirillum sp. CF444 TaxID=1144319 RepID=UPI0002726E68|nr:hypothetical protein [Herbaspirillum sp. CF444]EJL88514.1 hypothetical protein PMI16_02158 [Herbaspirillum sp. CF444]